MTSQTMTITGPAALLLKNEDVPVRVAVWLAENATKSTFASSLLNGFVRYGSLTQKQVAAVLRIVDAPAPKVAAEPADQMGIYVTLDPSDNGLDIYRVKRSKSSGNLYALRLDPTSGSFEYAPGTIRSLSASDRVTADEAALLGQALGICIVCGATLTDPESVARGIGPVCIKNV